MDDKTKQDVRGIRYTRFGRRTVYRWEDIERWSKEQGRQEASRLGLEAAAMAAGIKTTIDISVSIGTEQERAKRLALQQTLLVIATSYVDLRGSNPEMIAGALDLPFPLRHSDIDAKLAEVRAEMGA